MKSRIADVLDFRADNLVRKIVELRKKQSDRQQAVRRLESIYREHEKQTRRLCLQGCGEITVKALRNASGTGMEQGRAAGNIRKLDSELRIEIEGIARQRASDCKSLVAIRHKADYLHAKLVADGRKASRRRLARYLVSG